MNSQISAVLLGAGNRADVYASVSINYPEKLKIVGIVDPDPIRRELMRDKYDGNTVLLQFSDQIHQYFCFAFRQR